MRVISAAIGVLAVLIVPPVRSEETWLEPPKAGPVSILKISEVRPGMKGVAWTVFQGSKPEPVPVEIIGVWKNAWGPRQDVILAKLGGKAAQTNVAGGMSGSPVYIDGKLVGAIALRLSVFSPDAVCGITPIELMLEIDEMDRTRPPEARAPGVGLVQRSASQPPEGLLARLVAAGAQAPVLSQPLLTPIELPLTFSGFHPAVLEQFRPLFQQMGVQAVQGGAGGALRETSPAPGWETSLQPGEVVAGVLVSGDMNVTGLGTVTYNDGKKVLAFGHSFFNLGPVEMPMSKGEVLMVLASQYQPNKIANATEIVGALSQDRHSGILGELGRTAETIPVSVTVRSYGSSRELLRSQDFRFNVFVDERWTPVLMMVTLANTLQGVNDFAEGVTYRVKGEIELDGQQKLSLDTMLASSADMQMSAPLQLAGWWAEKFNRLFLNTVQPPRLKRVNAAIDLLPERRQLSIESAIVSTDRVEPGEEVQGVVFLRPYRGDRIRQEFKITIPPATPKGVHRILFSDASALNRVPRALGVANRFMDLPQAVALLNQERRNDCLYISLLESRPTLYYDDKSLTSIPDSVLNVLRADRNANSRMLPSGETAMEQAVIPFDSVVAGSYSVRITVK